MKIMKVCASQIGTVCIHLLGNVYVACLVGSKIQQYLVKVFIRSVRSTIASSVVIGRTVVF